LRILTLAVLALVAAGPGRAQTPSPGAAAPAPASAPEVAGPPVAVDANFKLGIGDQVVVQLIDGNGQESDSRPVVSADGKVLIPLLGEVPALGLKSAELAQAIQDGLTKGKFYVKPVVRVTVTGVASSYVTVLGEVGTGGMQPLDRAYHLSDMIARVGVHSGEGVGTIVLTHANGESKRYTLEDIATGASGGDPLLQAGDKIYIPAAAKEMIYISGQVRSPGAFPLSKDMTVRDAIARGGGLTELGSERKLKLFRKNVQVKDVKPDTSLQPGDILQIGERLF
jgi:polysaccharide export outer membrane protein